MNMNFITGVNLADYSPENGWRDVEKFNQKNIIEGQYRILKKEKTLVGAEYFIKCLKDLIALLTCGHLIPCSKNYFSNRLVVKIGIPVSESASTSLSTATPEELQSTTEHQENQHKPQPIDRSKLLSEFEEIGNLTRSREKQLPPKHYFKEPKYRQYHRFTNVECVRQTAVRLDGMPDDYLLHANQVQIDGYHCIATQYPYSEEGMSWFWEMVLQKGSVIVDLTNDSDKFNGKNMPPYFPMHSPSSLPSSSSTCHSESQFNCTDGIKISYRIRYVQENLEEVIFNTYEVMRAEDSDVQVITRIQVKCWPDNQGTDVDDLLQILKVLRRYQADANRCPIIHCRAGVGRTGTLIALLVASKGIHEGRINRHNLLEELSQIVLEGRQQRNNLFVQVPEQFIVLARACEKILTELEQSDKSRGT